jgi:hypothetical protein
MITDTDIKKLKTIFVTKEELQEVKIELKAEMIAMRVELKQDLINLGNRIIKEVTHIVSGSAEQLDDHEKELAGHRVAIGKLEKRVQKIEYSYKDLINDKN